MKRLLLSLVLLIGINLAWAQEYKMAGPYEVVARDGQYRSTKGGSERDMKAALTLAQTGKTAEALAIINAYAHTLQRLDGHDAPLCTIQGYDLVCAMTLLRDHKTPEWDAMLRRAFLPTIQRFEADSPYANGNWGAIVNRMRMAMGIEMQDTAIYQAAIRYFLHANDNGALPHYIDEKGQCQETGRDQGHVQLGLEALCHTCEMAWEQGDDLWGALDNRLMKGIEYTARYNLGFDVPFTTWTDCTGLYNDWTVPGPMSRGQLWDIYQLPYDHYVGRLGLQMPYTQKVLALQKNGKQPKVREYQKLHQAHAYPAPEGAPLKSDYEVYIQPRGQKEWTRIDTYMAKVNAPTPEGVTTPTGHRQSQISYAFFDFTGDVFVRVVNKRSKFQQARIRPDYRGVIANVQNDSTVQFLLFQPENVSVEFDGDITNNLLLFTSKPCLTVAEAQKEAKRQGRHFVLVPPGHYTDIAALQALMPQDQPMPPARAIDVTSSSAPVSQAIVRIPSNTTVYLSPGTYVRGTFAIEDATDVSLIGRGICRPDDGYEGCHIHRSTNVLVDGVILCTCPVGESHQVTLHDVRSISHPGWGDGLNVFGGCSDILFDRVFCRNSDDCTTIYATRKGFHGSVRNVRMRNSTLWADVAHPIMIGIHGDAEKCDTIDGAVYENIDILCQSEQQVDYQGCLAINCGDNNTVRNITFDNIRIECPLGEGRGSLVHIKSVFNDKYSFAPGGNVENILIRNLRYYGPTPGFSIIAGYSPDRQVRNVTFEGLKINGLHIYDKMPTKPGWYHTSDKAGFYVGNHVDGLLFK